jgi:hypothetical protein
MGHAQESASSIVALWRRSPPYCSSTKLHDLCNWSLITLALKNKARFSVTCTTLVKTDHDVMLSKRTPLAAPSRSRCRQIARRVARCPRPQIGCFPEDQGQAHVPVHEPEHSRNECHRERETSCQEPTCSDQQNCCSHRGCCVCLRPRIHANAWLRIAECGD